MENGFQVAQLAKVAEMVADAVISLASEVTLLKALITIIFLHLDAFNIMF